MEKESLERLKAIQDLWDHLWAKLTPSEKEKPLEVTVDWRVRELDTTDMLVPVVRIRRG